MPHTEISKFDWKPYRTQGAVVRAEKKDNTYWFEANKSRKNPPKIYGILKSPNNLGLYVPIGMQRPMNMQKVPICVGGGRAMHISPSGLIVEEDKDVIVREALEEIGIKLNISTVEEILGTVKSFKNAKYYLVTLKNELSLFTNSWEVEKSDQVSHVVYWPIPPQKPSVELDEVLFKELHCLKANLKQWQQEWHAEAYKLAIAKVMLLTTTHKPSFFMDLKNRVSNVFTCTGRLAYKEIKNDYSTSTTTKHVCLDGKCEPSIKPSFVSEKTIGKV
ncbi:hypothetical protein [Chromobacterium amazonense]|uniref:hypothetical protein n=1 Tax=Chromobacterium amazonense TaxID=1382803 RepID=UPI003F79672A